jgi:hypothetical protein
MAVQLMVQAATAPPPQDLADLGGTTPLQGFRPIPMFLELYSNPWHNNAHLQATTVVSNSKETTMQKPTQLANVILDHLDSASSKRALSKIGPKEIGGNPLWHSPFEGAEGPSSVHPVGSQISPCNQQSRLRTPIRHILVWREQFDSGRWDLRPRGAFWAMDFDSVVT